MPSRFRRQCECAKRSTDKKGFLLKKFETITFPQLGYVNKKDTLNRKIILLKDMGQIKKVIFVKVNMEKKDQCPKKSVKKFTSCQSD